MSYQVLARKWRPRTFQDLVGQEHVVRVLTNALNRKRLHHAYLYAGTRGVGKTTLARIFAKCLNCETALSATPCGTCSSCRALDAGQFLDLYEIDAASRTKVEDTRDLLENVAYPPVQGRYKVYLIDEVHMLSGHSFNALLKTLEEPPPQVIFILATTEPKRLPITVLSRCLQFHLKPILPEQIAAQLKRICDSEQVLAEDKALALLAQAADGSLRDALSLLDQAIVYCENSLTYEELNQMLGYISQDELSPLLEALVERDGKRLFEALAALQRRAPEYQHLLAELMNCLQQAAVFQRIPERQPNKIIRELAGKLSAEEIQLYYQIALVGQKDLSFAPSPAQGFEMVLLRMLAFQPVAVSQAKVVTPSLQSHKKEDKKLQGSAIEELKKEPPKQFEPAALEWRDLLAKLGLTGSAYALALNCQMESRTEDEVKLVLAHSYEPMMNPKRQEQIQEALSRYFNHSLRLSIRLTEAEVHSPTKQQEEDQKVRRSAALESLDQNSAVQKLKTLFNATIDAQSLELSD